MLNGLAADVVEQWFYDTLGNDAAGCGDRVFSAIAPRDAAFPYIIFNLQIGNDTIGLGGVRIMTNSLWLVKVVNKGTSLSTLKTIVTKIDNLINLKTGTLTDGSVIACYREQPVSYSELDQGVEFRHKGGLYRIYSQEAEVGN